MKHYNILRRNILEWYNNNGVNFSLNYLGETKNRYNNNKENRLTKFETQDNKFLKNEIHASGSVRARTLKELADELKGFDGCYLKKTAKNLVLFDGNPKAKVMLLGEAPGEEEDKTAKPFKGVAGKLLDKMLASIGQNRINTYLSNIVFWRPPGNRNPSEEEINTCLPFVIRQIEIIKPKILILAGSVATKALLKNESGITKLRGLWHDLIIGTEKIKVKTMPIFHPAFLLRQPARKREAWEDLKKIRQEILKLPHV